MARALASVTESERRFARPAVGERAPQRELTHVSACSRPTTLLNAGQARQRSMSTQLCCAWHRTQPSMIGSFVTTWMLDHGAASAIRLFPHLGSVICRARVGSPGLWTSERARQDVAQAHELDQLAQLGRGVPQPDPAAVPARGELKPAERVDGDGVGHHVADVAEYEVGSTRREQPADAPAEPGEVLERNRSDDRERGRPRRAGNHLSARPEGGKELIGALPARAPCARPARPRRRAARSPASRRRAGGCRR